MKIEFPQWLQMPSVKTSRTTQVIVSSLKWPGAIPHMNFGSMAKESYERNIPVYLCVNLIATSGAGVPWVLMKRGKSGAKAQRIMTKASAYKAEMFQGIRRAAVLKSLQMTEVDNHPALSLVENPNPMQSHAEYMVDNISYFLLSGNRYEEFVGPSRKDAPPIEMYSLRPDRVEILPNTAKNRSDYRDLAAVVDPSMWILGYLYTVDNNAIPFAAGSVLHGKFFHPTDDYYGLSPLQVAARHYRTDNLSADWNFALLKNQARPAGALIASSSIDDPTYDRLKAELEENYRGDNTGKPMILSDGFDWKQFGLSPLEMDWLAGTRDARALVCATYHVPPELTGDPEHRTYNSMPEARRAFWMEAVLPILDSIRDSYNNRLIPLFGDGLYLDYDRDQIDALAEDQAKVWDRVGKATFISCDEKREAVGYDSYEGDPEGDPLASVPSELLKGAPVANPFGAPPVDAQLPNPKAEDVPEHKAQALTRSQLGARKRLKGAMAKHYRGQGKDLAAYLKAEIHKL